MSTIPELFAAQYARTNGNLLECFRIVLEAEAMQARRPPVRMHGVDDEWLEARAKAIASAVAHNAGLTFKDLIGTARIGRVARTRAAAMLMVREMTDMSFPMIGILFGRRDHSTVFSACEKTRERIAARPKLGVDLRKLAADAMGADDVKEAA